MGFAAPMALQPVYKAWMRFGLTLNKITTPVILGLVFYLMITPTGLIRRLISKDSLARVFDDTKSYRVQSKRAPAENMEKPY